MEGLTEQITDTREFIENGCFNKHIGVRPVLGRGRIIPTSIYGMSVCTKDMKQLLQMDRNLVCATQRLEKPL